jgi:hypothetical protein
MPLIVEGVSIPDSKLAQEITEVVRDTEPSLLFHHSSRVYYFGALAGKHRGLKFELLYTRAMFHDMGLTDQHSSANERFEVDSRYPPTHAPCRRAGDCGRRDGHARGVQNVAIVSGYVGIYNTMAPEIGGGNTTVTIFRLRGK